VVRVERKASMSINQVFDIAVPATFGGPSCHSETGML